MRRGRGGRTRGFGASSVNLFLVVLALAYPRPVFTADYYAVDGISGKVASFIDWNDPTHALAQASGPLQVAIPAAHADYAGQLCANFTGAQWYKSNRTPASWQYSSDGTSFEDFLVFTPTSGATQVALATRSGVGVGYQMYWSGTAPHSAIADGASVTMDATFATGIVNGTPTYLNASYLEGASPEWFIRARGTLLASGLSALAPPPGVPASSLVLGAQANGTTLANMRLRSVSFFPVLATDQRATAQRWIQQDTGIPP